MGTAGYAPSGVGSGRGGVGEQGRGGVGERDGGVGRGSKRIQVWLGESESAY